MVQVIYITRFGLYAIYTAEGVGEIAPICVHVCLCMCVYVYMCVFVCWGTNLLLGLRPPFTKLVGVWIKTNKKLLVNV